MFDSPLPPYTPIRFWPDPPQSAYILYGRPLADFITRNPDKKTFVPLWWRVCLSGLTSISINNERLKILLNFILLSRDCYYVVSELSNHHRTNPQQQVFIKQRKSRNQFTDKQRNKHFRRLPEKGKYKTFESEKFHCQAETIRWCRLVRLLKSKTFICIRN